MNRNQQNSTESTTALTPKRTTALTPKQSAVIAALARGENVTNAAKEADVDRTSYYLWLKTKPHFVAELNRAEEEHRQAMRAQFQQLGDKAISTIQEILTENGTPPGIRLKAALAVLQGLGTLEPEEPGEIDPQKIASQQYLASLTPK